MVGNGLAGASGSPMGGQFGSGAGMMFANAGAAGGHYNHQQLNERLHNPDHEALGLFWFGRWRSGKGAVEWKLPPEADGSSNLPPLTAAQSPAPK